MTTSEIPHHRHRYPQGDLPPLATPGKTTPQTARSQGMVQKRVPAQGWLGSTPEGQRPQIRGLRAGSALAVASSIPATQLSSPARSAERVVTPHAPMTLGANHVSRAKKEGVTLPLLVISGWATGPLAGVGDGLQFLSTR